MAMELKHAILGLLSIQPMSGYDLNRAFSNTVAHFWYADQSQIYRTLDKLTATGQAELEDWLTSPLEQERFKEPFMARLFFAANLTYTEVVQLLTEREKQIERKLQSLKAIDAPAEDLASALRAATLRKGIVETEAELAWIQQTRESITRFSPPSKEK